VKFYIEGYKKKNLSRKLNLGENWTKIAGNVNENRYIHMEKLGSLKFHIWEGRGVKETCRKILS